MAHSLIHIIFAIQMWLLITGLHTVFHLVSGRDLDDLGDDVLHAVSAVAAYNESCALEIASDRVQSALHEIFDVVRLEELCDFFPEPRRARLLAGKGLRSDGLHRCGHDMSI